MNNLEPDDFIDDFGPSDFSDYGEELDNDFETPPRRRKLRMNPLHRIRSKNKRKLKDTTKKLPAKKFGKDMSVRKARKLLFGGRHPGRPSRELSEKLRQAKLVLQAAGEPTRRKNPNKVSLRPRGRPKKLVVSNREKRPRGRPRKPQATSPVVKRPRGRPKKEVLSVKVKRPRGRPRKNPLQQLADSIKKRGRPKSHPDSGSKQ